MIDQVEIKKRLASLSPAQRAQLAERLAAPGKIAPVSIQWSISPAKSLQIVTEYLPDGSPYKVTSYPASHSQQQMWFLHEYAEGRPVYNTPTAFHLKGRIDRQALLDAFSGLVSRHDTLRTTFSILTGELVQQVSSQVIVPWKDLSLDELPAEKRKEIAEQSLEEEAVQAFCLMKTPAFRVMLLRMQQDEHVLLVTLHHIISDGWSRSNLWRELSELYSARMTGKESQLIPLPLQFADYSTWHSQWLEGGEFEKQADFWKSNLSGDLEPLELPFDRSRPPLESFRGDCVRLKLDQSVVSLLTERAREAGSTFFMILLAAFNTLLYRYTGCDDLIVGVPVANRSRLELEPLIGYFVNTLVFRTSLAGQPTFLELMGRVKEVSIAALEHQSMPFEKLVDILKIPRNASHTPIFQTCFALRDFPDVEFSVPGLKVEQWDVLTRTAKFDLSLTVERSGNDWITVVEYSTDLFDEERVTRMLGHWQNLLKSIAADPSRKLPDLEMLGDRELHQILVEWNDTATDYPRDKCVHQLFAEQAAHTPDAVAVVFADKTLTYRELDLRAGRLAEHLRNLGVKPGDLVAIRVERSLEMIIGILGILKAGGAYWALEDNLPDERFCWMLADSKPGVLLTRRESLVKIRELVSNSQNHLLSNAVCVSAIEDLVVPAIKNTPDSVVASRPDDPVYVNYTSGSTGKPKAVVVKHRGVVRLVKGVDYAALGAEETFLHLSPLSFDVSTFEIWGALLNGGRVVLMPPGPPTLAEIGEFIRRHQVSTAWLTAGLFHLMVDERVNDLKPLRQLLAGGDVLSPELVAVARRELPGCRIINGYGPTENTTFTSCHTLKTDDDLTRTVPIGRPISNTSVYILDSALKPVPVGVPGELYTGGDGVAIGYLNQPELTAERFIPDPFSSRDGDRLYRTGDRARWFPDGNIEFMGRLDSQVKLRGFRIETGEIETMLIQHPDIAACAILLQKDAAGEKSLAAYLVTQGQTRLSVESLRGWLAGKVPDYMIPAHFFVLPRLPLTQSGKVDRKALARMNCEELFVGADYEAPRNELESGLVEIWQELLHRDRIGINDNFFAMGGHSLLAAVMCSRITGRFGFTVPLRKVFELPVIEGLAKELATMAGELRNLTPVMVVDRGQPLLMSFALQGMWILHQTVAEFSAYNVAIAWRLSGSINLEFLCRSLRCIMERHEILRTSLILEEDKLLQVIADSGKIGLPWQEIDLSFKESATQSKALEEILLNESRAPFNLAQAPLWRVLWVKLGAEEQALAITFHHSIVDEWSLRLMFEELERLYAAAGQPELACLPELPVQYADYSSWQRQRLTGSLLVELQNYWREQLRDLPVELELPADQIRTPGKTGRGAVHDFSISTAVVASFRYLARQEKTTLFTVVLAAFQVWLHRYSGQTDIVVCTPMANRLLPEVQPLIGFLINTLPVRTRLNMNQSFLDVLRQVRGKVLEAFDHADLPFEQIVELAIRDGADEKQPVCQVLFVLLEEDHDRLNLGGIMAHKIRIDPGTSKVDLTLFVQAVGESWECRLEYSSDLFSSECAARMVRHLNAIFSSISENPEKRICELNLLSPEERYQLLVEWNDTATDYPRDKCVHQLFAEQAAHTPDAVAVVFADKTLTYRELDLRAGRLAEHLRNLGVKPGDLVAIRVERSLEMIIGILGILKAGGAYWALEENLPKERLGTMFAATRPQVLLTCRALVQQTRELVLSFWHSTSAGNIAIVAIEDLSGSLPEKNLQPVIPSSPTDPVYVNFTSGSTGQPKAVLVPHRGVVRLVKNVNYVSLSSEDTFLHLSPLSFDASTFELWGALLNGGRVILLPPGPPSLEEIGVAIRQHQVTILWLTASLFHLMVEERPDDLRPLRQLLAGGDVLSPEHVCKARLALPGCRIINGYGPTENTTFTCCYTVKDSLKVGKSVPIGRPISNTRVYVLDSALQLVPIGVPGELYAGGDGIAAGYLNQPELTATRFIPDPFSSQIRDRLYRTGDRVRWLSDGNLEFLGRLDSQIKIRGFRVEMGEIEAVLRDQPEIKEAKAFVDEDKSGEKRILVNLVSRAESKIDSAILRSRLAEKLPEYMLPHSFIWLDRLPLLANGKVDVNSLQRLEPGDELPDKSGGPVNLLELELIRIWQKLLKQENIGRQDNFFALGGHSLMAARMVIQIEEIIGCKLPIAALFQSPTIELLARRFSDENWSPPWSSLVPLQPNGSRPPLFFVHGLGGDVYGFLDLTRLLSPDQPCYGIQALGLDGRCARHKTIEEMASHYVKEMVSLQPDGPYYIVGYSMGGIIAFEVARQLRLLDKSVAKLFILDSSIIGPAPRLFYMHSLLSFFYGRCLFHWQRWLKMPKSERISYLRGRWTAVYAWLFNKNPQTRLANAAVEKGHIVPTISGFEDYYATLGLSYRLKPYSGSAVIFESISVVPRWRLYWRHLVRGGVSFLPLAVHHHEILSRDYLPELARIFTAELVRVQENYHSSS